MQLLLPISALFITRDVNDPSCALENSTQLFILWRNEVLFMVIFNKEL